MDLPDIENHAFAALARLANRPTRFGEIDGWAARQLIDNGLVIRFHTIFLITPLGLVQLQNQPFRNFKSRSLDLLRWLFGLRPDPQTQQQRPRLAAHTN